jgi:ribosomal protein S12 methylthiotransferase accessory factor
MPLEQARAILPEADFRPPVRRGDIDALPAGTVVGIIDGVFDQELAVSPRELHNGLRKGLHILGSSSMGALRASEVRGITGIGRVYEMFRDGIIERDDEVALLFSANTFQPMTEPLVNIRHAVDSLLRSGTLAREVGQKILTAARRLHYRDRDYRLILRQAGLANRPDAAQLIAMLQGQNLKREDAQLLLEALPAVCAARQAAGPSTSSAAPLYETTEYEDHLSRVQLQARMPPDADVLIWEYGDTLRFDELVRFLKLTGEFLSHAHAAVTRFLLQGNTLKPPRGRVKTLRQHLPYRQHLLQQVFSDWGWLTAEEARVTLVDLGLGMEGLVERLDEEVDAQWTLSALVLQQTHEFLEALRSQLVMDRIALKRAALRLGSLRTFAKLGRAEGRALERAELHRARERVCRLSGTWVWSEAVRRQALLGVSEQELEQFVEELAYAWRGGVPLLEAMAGKTPAARPASQSRKGRSRAKGLELRGSPKAPGSLRFSLPLGKAEAITRRVAKAIGVTRVSMIGELDDLGVRVSQAFRPHSPWSSTVGSGKGETRAGARVGGIMEEAEKYAQEKFRYEELTATYAELSRREPTVDPATLDLPYDSRYHEHLEIGWTRCFELLGGGYCYLPSAAVDAARLKNDIYYSARRGKKIFTTNGLASGFTLEEALTHAACEFIERHATRIADLRIRNPATTDRPGYSFVDLNSAPASIRRLTRKLTSQSGYRLRVLDITSEVRVPTFEARLFIPTHPRVTNAVGTAAHPNPEVAIQMAMLEAAQTKTGSLAGAREDLTVMARSLGRHERPRPSLQAGELFFFGAEPEEKPFQDIQGLVSSDLREDLKYVLEALRNAGLSQVLALDYSVPELAPVRAARVIVPGLETINPFYTGPRARLTAIRDLLPRVRP